MADPVCYYCDRAAEAECPTCGRVFCPDHGDAVCLRCMAPESATPGALAYRGSLVALVIASLVVLYLVFRPPGSSNGQETLRTIATANPGGVATATPTRQGGVATVAPTRTAPPATTPGAGTPSVAASPSPGATQAPAAQTYTVKPGDTLGAIATQFNTTVAAILAANPSVEAGSLQIGTVLKIP